ncbi:MAG: RNase adapter RapZ, partial [Candidatus Aquilonibacter sp.]
MSAARIVFVTGLSGAGKSQAIKTFEDLGFYCVEHLPPAALDATLRVLDAGRVGDIAITLVEHGDALLGNALATIEATARTRPVDVLYLEARNDAVVRRFSETRRRHPFEAHGSLREAIAAEREALLPLRERATMTIDTTALNHASLKERLAAAFAPNELALLTVTI